MNSNNSLMDQAALQALIAETEALGWDKPYHLVVHNSFADPQEGFAFIGKLLALKTQNVFHVRAFLFCLGICSTTNHGALGIK
jgi:hypothetical protein